VLGQPPYGCAFSGGELATITGVPSWEGTSFISVEMYDSDSPPTYDTLGITITVTALSGVCGDADGSGDVDIDDVVFLLNYVFGDGPAPNPLESGDVDCSEDIDIDDVVYLISYIFSGGPEPCEACS
ncbi:MAG: hypothetical protein KAT85_12115, partial [candidate division Zixibacteria bacterium]|nr:hypothetical protein [candidate division Zixibacteria bacterium]